MVNPHTRRYVHRTLTKILVIKLPIEDEDVKSMGKHPEDYFHVPLELHAEFGNRVLGGLEVNHQLHCLVRIHKTNT
jgi:hypothetical protein